MNYWLMKSDPDTYSWEDLLQEKRTMWDGVRNYQARNNLQKMHHGDQVLFYHSFDKEVVGLTEVVREPYPDPTADDDKWVVVDVVPVETFARKVSLAQIKEEPELQDIKLIRQSRLSVMPLTQDEFERILKMGRGAE